jgi:hypothetical protein
LAEEMEHGMMVVKHEETSEYHQELSEYHHDEMMKQLVMVHVMVGEMEVEMEHVNAGEMEFRMELEKKHGKMKEKRMQQE